MTKESAPLAIFVDLTSSAGISAEHIAQRGAAILALVRLLTDKRPVELWAGAALNTDGMNAGAVFARIDTAPLDLARAAHILTEPSVSRGLCYGIVWQHMGSTGNWAFGDVTRWRNEGASILKQALPHSAEVLFMPPIFMTDDSINKPVQWIETMLARYGGLAL